MKYIVKITTIAFTLLMAIVYFSSCAKSEPNPVPFSDKPKLDALLTQNADLSLFKAAMDRADLGLFLTGVGDFTLMAPNNAALNTIGLNTPADIAAIDKTALANFLLYHVLTDRRAFINIPIGPNATISSQNGVVMYASKYGENLFINGASAVTKDIQASNGVIHVLNRPLVIPIGSAIVSLQSLPQFRLFLQAINKTATTSSFTPSPTTIFAPTNAAMTAAGYDSTTIANASGAALTTLTGIIRHHAVAGRFFSCDLQPKTYKTAQGTFVTVSLTGSPTVKGVGNPSAIAISGVDLLTSAGVIHSISGVLRP
jgi:uncharacterized surface protein with fasciclin (FAS1) repeats